MHINFTGRNVVCWMILILLACGIGKGFYEKCKTRDTYEHAIDLMAEGEYQETYNELKLIEDEYYLDVQDLRDLCNAHMNYEEQDYSRAYWGMDDLQFSHLTPKQKEELQIEEFQKEVSDAYDVWSEEENARIQRDLEREKALEAQNRQKKTAGGSSSYGNSYRRSTYQPAYTYDDIYDVYDYDDPEDFYYDYEDDFDGYEDAEDYWEDAWE